MPSSDDTDNPDTCFEIEANSLTPPLSSQNSNDSNDNEKIEDEIESKSKSSATFERKKSAASGEATKMLPDSNCATVTTATTSLSESDNHYNYNHNNSMPMSPIVPRGTLVTNAVTNDMRTNALHSESQKQKSVIIMPLTNSVVCFQQEDNLVPMNAASTSDEDNTGMKGASESSTCLHHLEPEGLRNKQVSRRFDEAMLKEVMMQEEEDRKSLETDDMIPSTIVEEEEEPQHQSTHIESNGPLTEDTMAPVDSENPGSGTAPHEKHRQESAISKVDGGRMPGELPGTQAREPEDTIIVPIETLPPLPSQATAIAESHKNEEQWNEPAPIDYACMPPKQSPTLESPHEDDQQSSRQSLTMPQHAFTAQVPQNEYPASALSVAPLGGQASVHLHTVDFNSVSRSSLSSVMANGYHHAGASTTNGLGAYPNGEVGIPHMPPLALPQSNGVYHGLAAALSPAPPTGGKRKIHLRLVEDISKPDHTSLFSSFRKRSILRKNPITLPIDEQVPSRMQTQWVDRGSLTVSWYEGTSSLELQEHVRSSVIRKVRLQGTTKLADFRVLDDSVDPPEGTTVECFKGVYFCRCYAQMTFISLP
jgi:hypothetical protein